MRAAIVAAAVVGAMACGGSRSDAASDGGNGPGGGGGSAPRVPCVGHSEPGRSPPRADSCEGETVCVQGYCAAAYGRRYRMVLAARVEAQRPDGTPWDDDGTAPDIQVRILLDGREVAVSKIAVDALTVPSEEHVVDVASRLPEVRLQLLEVDELGAEVVVSCTGPLDAYTLHHGGPTCGSVSGFVNAWMLPLAEEVDLDPGGGPSTGTCAQQLAGFRRCAAAPTGSWQVVDYCIGGDRQPPGNPLQRHPECQDAAPTLDDPSATGAFSFAADGSFHGEWTARDALRMKISRACLQAVFPSVLDLTAACTTLGQQLDAQAEKEFGFPLDTTCTMSGTRCDCVLGYAQPEGVDGRWADGFAGPLSYCRSSDQRLQLRASGPDGVALLVLDGVR